MSFDHAYTSREQRFSLGRESDSGTYFVSFPVSNGLVDYEEFYAISPDRYAELMQAPLEALPFVEECREHKHDDLLIQKPGWNRGIPV